MHPSLAYLIINLNPIALRLGPLAIHWYGLAYVLAISVALWATLHYADALGVPREILWRIFLWSALAGLIGGRLYFDIQQPDFLTHYLLAPINLIAVWQGGMAYFGAIFAAAPTAAILAWRAGLAPWLALDLAALFGAVGQMFGRLGNLVNGDIVGYVAGHPTLPATLCAQSPCIGYVNDAHVLPWATAYLNPASFIAQRGVPYQPAAAYEIIINLATLALLWPLRLILPRQVRAGAFFCLYVASYALGQFLVFFARSNVFVSFVGIDLLKQAQWTALVTLLGIIAFYFGIIRRWGIPWPHDRRHPIPLEVQHMPPPPQAPLPPPLPPRSRPSRRVSSGSGTNRHHLASGKLHQQEVVERETDVMIGSILRGGVLLSAGVIVVGLLLFALSGAHLTPFPHTLPTLVQSVAHGQPLGIVMVGVVVLIATPVMRVAISILAFALEEDRPYVLITAGVLSLLLISIGVLGARLADHTITQHVLPSLPFFCLVLVASMIAGLVGALVGLGGGVFVVPLLTVGFGLPIEVAIGASIVSVIATSSGAAAAYVRDHLINLRVGMLLELATTLGAIGGALLAEVLAPKLLFLLFGLVLLISAVPLIRKLGEDMPQGVTNDWWARHLRLASSYPDTGQRKMIAYNVTHVPQGFGLMGIAGLISGLLGIGSGTFKVLAMDTAMRLPMKVSSTTSNFMIGVTAAASAGIYFQRGAIDPLVAAPVALGVLGGALLGATILPHLANATIRKVFVPLVVLIATEMVVRAL